MQQSSPEARGRFPRDPGGVLILGAGIGGLCLALSLHQAGIACRVFEAVPALKPMGI